MNKRIIPDAITSCNLLCGSSSWSRSDSIEFKKNWIFGMGAGLAGEEFNHWFNNRAAAGYNAGMKYKSYTKLIRKEVA